MYKKILALGLLLPSVSFSMQITNYTQSQASCLAEVLQLHRQNKIEGFTPMTNYCYHGHVFSDNPLHPSFTFYLFNTNNRTEVNTYTRIAYTYAAPLSSHKSEYFSDIVLMSEESLLQRTNLKVPGLGVFVLRSEVGQIQGNRKEIYRDTFYPLKKNHE